MGPPRSPEPDVSVDPLFPVALLLDLAERLVARLESDAGAEAKQITDEAASFLNLFRRWCDEPPPAAEHIADGHRFLLLHHRAADYVSRASAAAGADESEPSPSQPLPAAATHERVAREAMDRLEADASLRADLTPAEMEPLLDWARDRAFAAASNVGRRVDAADAVNRVAALLGRVVRAAAQAAQTRGTDALRAEIEACPRAILERELAVELLRRVPLAGEPASSAAAIAAALCAAAPLDP